MDSPLREENANTPMFRGRVEMCNMCKYLTELEHGMYMNDRRFLCLQCAGMVMHCVEAEKPKIQLSDVLEIRRDGEKTIKKKETEC